MSIKRLIPICLFMIGTASAQEVQYTQGTWTVAIDSTGTVASLADKGKRQLAMTGAGDNRLRVALVPAGKSIVDVPDAAFAACDRPTKIEKSAVEIVADYDLTPAIPLNVRYAVRFSTIKGFPTLERTVTLTPTAPPLTQDVILVVGNNLGFADSRRRVFTPRYNGLGEDLENTPGRQWIWRLNGEGRLLPGTTEDLALPLLSDADRESGIRLTHIADPFFTTSLRIADAASKRNGEFACVYQASKVPMREPEQRTFWTVVQSGEPEKAIEAWYATALADVPEGPDWLHHVAWQHYDYLSRGGRDWFADIDAAEKLVAREDRQKVVFTLHGWYDSCGRYAFNEKTGQLDDEWTAFPSAAAVKDKGFAASETTKMSKADMHRRIRYAKDRGFRVCVYFADGLNCCDGLKDIFSPDQVLSWGGWSGPDTVGKSYAQNPLHPRVYNRYVNYLKAMLAEYGDEIDALVWDETFYIRAGTVATGEHGGYAARRFMRLIKELTLTTTKLKPRVAFLASDCQGATFDGKSFWLDVPPYAMMAHGCYQDTHCAPESWPYAVFANLRNVLWSCNWQAATHFDYTKFGVEHYRVPVATSNGWLDNKGIAGLTDAERSAVLELFSRRKTQRQELKWLTAPPPQFSHAK